MSDKSQRTEQPTEKRLKKAREEGQFPTAREFVGGMQFLTVVAALSAWGGGWFANLKETTGLLMLYAFRSEINGGELQRIWQTALARIFIPLFAVGMLLCAVTLGIQLCVTRFGFTLKRVNPNWGRLNPISRLKGLPKQNAAAVLQAIFTLIFCGLAAYYMVKDDFEDVTTLPLMPLGAGVQWVFSAILNLLWKSALIFVVFGCIDLVRQRREYNTEMRMSRQDIRDEMKEVEGHPMIKAQIRRLQRAARRRKMLRQVPTATAVIVNPTHYAVALQYDMEAMTAPVVVAKGKNYLALRIRHLAEHHEVPLIENPPLAQALYKSVPVGAQIPAELYRAVAEVLAYVFRMMKKSG